MRRIICLFPFLAQLVLINAQDNKRDSLLKLLPSSKEDTAKVMLLLNIADIYETNNQDSSVYYLEKSRQLSESLSFTKGIYHYYNQSAVVSFTKGDYARAVEQNNKALDWARQLKDSFQIPVYAYLAAHALDAPEGVGIEGRYLLLRSPGNPVVAQTIDKDVSEEVRQRIDALMQKVSEGRLEPDPADKQACIDCEYRRLCRLYGT